MQEKFRTSSKDLTRKFGIPCTTAQEWINKSWFKSFKAVRVPNRNDKQDSEAKIKAGRLLRKKTPHDGCLIFDDETLVELDNQTLPGQKFYLRKVRLNIPNKFDTQSYRSSSRRYSYGRKYVPVV